MNTRKLFSFILFVCILLTACTPATSPTALPITPTIIVPTATISTIPPAPELTTFSSKVFELPMAVSFGQGDWHVIDDFTDLVTVAGKQKDWNIGFNIVTNAEVADPINGAQLPFPADFAAWIKSNPDFKADEPTQVTVAGLKGLQIDATPIATKQKDFLYLSGIGWKMIPKPEGWRFILLNDVNGERLLILLIAPADQFKDAVQQAQAILDTVVFTK